MKEGGFSLQKSASAQLHHYTSQISQVSYQISIGYSQYYKTIADYSSGFSACFNASQLMRFILPIEDWKLSLVS